MTTPAQNIAKTGEFADAFFFHSICDCTSSDHEQGLVVEVDDEGYWVTLTIYQDLYWADWRGRDRAWPIRLWRRIANAAKYLVTGHVRVSGDHMLKEAHVRDYANALLGAADELEKRKAAYLKNKASLAAGKSTGATTTGAMPNMQPAAGDGGDRGTSPGSKDVQGQGNDPGP
jgi:hypothetical protein